MKYIVAGWVAENYDRPNTDCVQLSFAPEIDETVCFRVGTLFDEVIRNLLNNGWNASRRAARSPLIKIDLSEEAGKVLIRVSDNGSGIPADILPKLFKMKVDHADRFNTGMGLLWSRIFLTFLDGTINLTTPQPQIGAGFDVRLPIVRPTKQ